MTYTKTTWETDDIITASGLNNIETALDTIGNTITETITNGTPLSTYFTDLERIQYHLRKVGNVVTIQFNSNPTSAITAYYGFAQVPTEFKPTEDTYVAGFYGNAAVNILIPAGAGAIQCISQNIGTGNRLCFTATYIRES